MTDRLYLADPYLAVFEAVITGHRDGWVSLDRSAFYPGGGGQPADLGSITAAGTPIRVAEVSAEDGQVWHRVDAELPAGTPVEGTIDWPRRHALMRAHGLMHVVNSLARDRFDAAITGVQLGVERSRIDLRLDGFSREHLPDFEEAVNAVIARDLPVRSYTIPEADYRARPELVRTLDVEPPVIDGQVRVVEIVGFDSQACGGTHVHGTAEIGIARITRFDNKGRNNKRLYWEFS